MSVKTGIILFITLIVFFSCDDGKSNRSIVSKKQSIDDLFKKADDQNVDLEKRKFHLKKVENELEVCDFDTILRDTYINLALRYYQINDLKSFKSFSKKIEEKSLSIHDTVGMIQSKCFLATYFIGKYQNDSAYYYYSKGEKLSRSHKLKPFLGSILINKAELLTYQKDFSGSETLATQALRIGNERNDNSLVYECYLILGKSLKGLNNDEVSMNYYLKALEKTDVLKENYQYLSLKAQIYNYIALLCQKQNKHKKAIEYIQKALSLGDFRHNDMRNYCYLISTLAYSKFKLGDDDCLQLFKETLKTGDSLESIPIQLTSKLYLSEYYLSKKDSLKAKRFSEEAKQLAYKNKVFEDELKALELLAKIDPVNDSHYNQQYITLSDSLQNVERATRNKFARIEFETDEITNQKNLAETEKEKISAQRWMILGFSLFFIVLLMLLYVSHRQRSKDRELQYLQQQQKANEEIYRLMLDQQQKIEEGKQIEKRRISKELHDGVMGKLTSIRLNLFVLGRNPDAETLFRCMEHVNEIQNIEKEIRKISHDLNQNLFTDVSDFILMVNNLVDNIKEHSHVHFKIITDEKIDWNIVNSVVKMQVYRILQEALHNIEKYAQAKNVVISMLEKEQKLSVSITDDGIGFDVNMGKSGIGHKNMRERAAEIRGEFTISSIVGKGTKINLIIPT